MDRTTAMEVAQRTMAKQPMHVANNREADCDDAAAEVFVFSIDDDDWTDGDVGE